MNNEPLNCPNCGGSIKINDKRNILFCPFCGVEIGRQTTALDKILQHRKEMYKIKHPKNGKKKDLPEWAYTILSFLLAFGFVAIIIVIAIYG